MEWHCKDLNKQMNPKVQIWENPCGGMRKMGFVQDLIRNETTYCQWGFTYRKATDFFSNINLHLRPLAKMEIAAMRKHPEEQELDCKLLKTQL